MRRSKPNKNLESPATRLRGFIAKFEPEHQALIKSIRAALRRRLPTAWELVYDNYNFFVIGYGPTERPSEAILSLVAGASGVSLCLLHGARLPDPHRVLLGAGKQTRFIRLESAAAVRRPEIAALVDAAVANSPAPFARTGRGPLVIRSVSAKQRPRRKPLRG